MTQDPPPQLAGQPSAIIGTAGYLDWNQYATLKGLLIFLIVMGHNSVLTDLYPDIAWVLYNFHVSAFLIIPFLFPADALEWRTLRDKFVRYMVPFAIFILVMSPLWWLLKTSANFSAWQHMEYTFKAITYGTAPLTKSVTGFGLIWFLPALTVLTFLRALYFGVPQPARRVLLAAIVCGALAVNWWQLRVNFMVFGYPIALYIFPLGLLAAALARRCAMRQQQLLLLVMLLVAFVILQWISLQGNIRFDLAIIKFPRVATNPALFVAQLCLIVVGFLVCFVAARYLDRLRMLRVLGQYSLLVYLTHSPLFQLQLGIAERLGIGLNKPSAAALTLLTTLILSLGVSFLVSTSSRLRNLITPRDYSSFKQAFVG